MGRKGRERFEQNYTVGRMTAATLQVYQNILQKNIEPKYDMMGKSTILV